MIAQKLSGIFQQLFMNLNKRIAVVGAGKISWSLVPAIKKAGFKNINIISRNIKSAEKLARLNNLENYSDNLISLAGEELIILAVPDDSITGLSQQISKFKFDFVNQLYIHLSGSKPADELRTLSGQGAAAGSLHIMQTFPERAELSIKGSRGAVEANDKETRQYLSEFARLLGINAVELDGDLKTAYHLLGVFTSNFMVANYFNAEKIISHSGLKMISSAELTKPIVKQTLENLMKKSPEQALSGTIERGDISTVLRHIETLRHDRLLLLDYLSGSLSLLEAAKKKNSLSEEVYRSLKTLLVNELKKIIIRF